MTLGGYVSYIHAPQGHPDKKPEDGSDSTPQSEDDQKLDEISSKIDVLAEGLAALNAQKKD
jgi:hypothetical protein